MSDMVRNEAIEHKEEEQQQEGAKGIELSPGAQLSSRRQALNWSIDHVANQLNLAPRQIHALESDNYAALPGLASVRGFIRSYAKLLNIDAAPLLEVVAKETTAAEHAAPLRRELPSIRIPQNRLSTDRNRLLMPAAILLVVLVLVAGGMFILRPSSVESMLLAAFQTTAKTDSDAAARLRPQEAAVPNTTIDIDTSPVNTATPNTESDASVGPDLVEQRDARADERTLDNGATAAQATVAKSSASAAGESGGLLTLKLHEDSWIEIRRPDNSPIFAALMKAGASESFNITGPVTMVVGNAAGVQATLRGKRIELKVSARSNVARLTLK
jgi:cytoskeleton protein RodZ